MARTVASSRRRLGCAVVGAAVLAVLVWFSSNLFAFQDGWDAQGGANFWCLNTNLPPVPNGDGWVVTAHRTDCDTLAKDSAAYIYLHRLDQPDLSYSLILRYNGDDPEVRWTDPHHVSIVARHVSEVDKQVARLWGITITCDLQRTWGELP